MISGQLSPRLSWRSRLEALLLLLLVQLAALALPEPHLLLLPQALLLLLVQAAGVRHLLCQYPHWSSRPRPKPRLPATP
jgi:hypothetical protein